MSKVCDEVTGPPTPAGRKEDGMRDARRGGFPKVQDPDYLAGYYLGLKLVTLKEFIRLQGAGVPAGKMARACMRFLMHKQYGARPPKPCPCY